MSASDGGGRRERLKTSVSNAASEDGRLLDDMAAESERRLAEKKAQRAEARRIRLEERLREQEQAEQDGKAKTELEEKRKRLAEREERRGDELAAAPAEPEAAAASAVNDTDTDGVAPAGSSAIARLSARIGELEAKYKEAAVLTEQLQNVKSAQVFEIEKLKDKLEDTKEELAEAKAELRRRTTDIRELEHSVRSNKETIDVLEDELHELRTFKTEMMKAQQDQETAAKVRASQGDELAIKQSQPQPPPQQAPADGPVRRSPDDVAKISQLMEELRNSKAERMVLEDEMEELRSEASDLRTELRELRKAASQKQAEAAAKAVEQPPPPPTPPAASAPPTDVPATPSAANETEDFLNQAKLQRLEAQTKRLKAQLEKSEDSEDAAKREARKLAREVAALQQHVKQLEASLETTTQAYERLRARRQSIGSTPSGPSSPPRSVRKPSSDALATPLSKKPLPEEPTTPTAELPPSSVSARQGSVESSDSSSQAPVDENF